MSGGLWSRRVHYHTLVRNVQLQDMTPEPQLAVEVDEFPELDQKNSVVLPGMHTWMLLL